MSRRLWLLIAVASLAGCARCSKGPAAAGEVARYLPKDAAVAVVVPRPAELGRKLTILQGLNLANMAASTQGVDSGQLYVDGVMQQVGVDVRSAESIAAAGISPDRPIGYAGFVGGGGYAVVGVEDLGKLRDRLRALAEQRLGAREHRKQGELELFSATKDGPAALGFITKGKLALIAAPPLLQELSSYAQLPAERALSEDEGYKAAVKRLPSDADALIHSPNANSFNDQLPARVTGALRLSEEALVVTLDMPRANDAPGAKALRRVDGRDLRSTLPEDAFMVARYHGDPSDLGAVWRRFASPRLVQAAQESGFDVDAELFANLESGGVLALVVAQSAQLGGGMPSLDIRTTNPFQFVNLVGLTRVKDPAKLAKTLEKLPAAAPRVGATVEKTDKDGAPLYVTRYAAGQGVHFAPRNDLLVLASPMSRMETTLQALASPSQKVGAAAQLLSDRPFSFALDLKQLAQSIQGLPSSSWGLGGFAIKATTLKWLEAISDLRAVTGSVEQKDGAVHAELALRFEKKQ